MPEFALAILIFIGVMAVTALVFGGWVIVNVFKGIGALIGIDQTPPPRRMVPIAPPTMATGVAPGMVQCKVPGCRHMNPNTAGFCRHCGHAFPPAAARRVAML